jgi:hypothetical protein
MPYEKVSAHHQISPLNNPQLNEELAMTNKHLKQRGMSPQESRELKPTDRVGFIIISAKPPGSPIDFGTVLANNKHAVQIRWDDVKRACLIKPIIDPFMRHAEILPENSF